jgi:flagellar FliL protein
MKKMMIIIIAAVLVIVLAGGAVTYTLVMRSVAGSATEATSASEPAKVTLYNYPLTDSFVTNVKGSNKLFKLTVVLVMNEDPAGEELKTAMTANEYQIRDSINVLLRTKTVTDLTADNVEESLRSEIASTLNHDLGVEYFVSAYFTDFVLS